MSLFSMRNEFDGSTVTLDAADHTPNGPFTVTLVFEDGAVSIDDEVYTFTDLSAAFAKFTELVKNEIEAVLGEIQ